jgi:AraC family transcriptional regulator, transcriptional activator of pobA
LRTRARTAAVEGVLAERQLASPIWVGHCKSCTVALIGKGEVGALVYGDGEIDVVSPRAARALAATVRALDGTAVIFDASLLATPARRRGDTGPKIAAPTPLERAWARGGHFAIPVEARRSWSERLVAIESELRIPAIASDEAVEALLRLLLIDAARLAEAAPSARPAQIVMEAAAVIDQRFRGRLSLADVAAAVAISPSQLSRLVRRATGRSVVEWIRDRRMEEARRLLRDTDASIEFIAIEIGYRDVAHFRRHFVRTHETTPGRWRKRARRSHHEVRSS